MRWPRSSRRPGKESKMESKRSQEVNPAGFSPPSQAGAKSSSPKILGENSETFSEKSFTNSFLQMDCAQCDVVENPVDRSFDHADDRPTRRTPHVSSAIERAKLFEIRRLAENIMSIAQLRRIVRSADPKLRKGVYNLIAPLITRFIPPTYRQLLGRGATTRE